MHENRAWLDRDTLPIELQHTVREQCRTEIGASKNGIKKICFTINTSR